MGWATSYIEDLKAGKTVSFRPRGNSMLPRIQSGQLCTVTPPNGDLNSGAIVLCRVKGQEYLHYIQQIQGSGGDKRFLIGNARGHSNGWVGLASIFGVLVDT